MKIARVKKVTSLFPRNFLEKSGSCKAPPPPPFFFFLKIWFRIGLLEIKNMDHRGEETYAIFALPIQNKNVTLFV